MVGASPLTVATNIFASPSEAFGAIRARPSVWLPIVVLILGYCAISFLYMTSVDLPWFMERQMQAANLPAEQREQAIENALNVSPLVYGAIGAASTTVFVLLWITLTALYYTAWSFGTGDGVKLKQWFALVCWCTLPVVFGLLASVVNVLATDARFLLQERINPLAFGSLLSIDSEGATVSQRILLGLDLTTLWSIVLTVLGYQAWTQRSVVTATAIVLGPLAVIAGIGALAALV